MQSTKRFIIILLLVLLSLHAFAQIKFETGYVIDNDNNKIECLIENKDWSDNPTSFVYKLADKDQLQTGLTTNITEFVIYNYARYVRASVEVDTTNTFVISKLSYSKRPQWANKTIFLKELVVGSAHLYQYQNGDLLAFFFNTTKNSSIRQLVYKKYFADQSRVGENMEFKQQLINELSCDQHSGKIINNIKYSQSSLKKYFTTYNACLGDSAPVLEMTTDSSKYIKASVEVDITNTLVTSNLSYSKRPQWANKTVSLKVLVSGSANLYQYQNGELLAFFFNTTKNSSIRQLVYKKYFTDQSHMSENMEFKQQLINELSCGEHAGKNVNNVKYSQSSLKKYFIEYNICVGDSARVLVMTTDSQPMRPIVKFRLTPGLNLGSMSLEDQRYYLPGPLLNVDFKNQFTFRIGVESEFILPFNKNKWSVLVEPTYQYFKAKNKSVQVDYESIEFPIGFRYYAFLENSSLFFNFIFLPRTYIDLGNPSRISATYGSGDITPIIGFSLGGGYSKGPFSLEARYYLPQNLSYQNPNYKSIYQRLALIAGFRFAQILKKIRPN